MKRNLPFLAVVLLSISLLSCKKEEANPDPSTSTDPCDNAVFSCTINGTAYSVAGEDLSTTMLSNQSGKRLDIRTLMGGNTVILTISDTYSDEVCIVPRVDTVYADATYNTYPGWTNGDYADGTLFTILDDGKTYITSLSGGKEGGHAVITDCDATAKTISGTFEFEIRDFFSDSLLFSVTNGEFVDVCF